MHMSHKKRATTAFKSIGAAGLVAATIVSGLSFGPAAAQAAPIKSHPSSIGINAATTPTPTAATRSDVGTMVQGTPLTPTGVGARAADDNGVTLYGTPHCVNDYISCGLIVTQSPVRGAAVISSGGRYNFQGWSRGETRTLYFWSAATVYAQGIEGGVTIRSEANVPVQVTRPGPTTVALTASVTKVNNIANSAVIGGSATPNGTVTIGSKTVNVSSGGAWSMTVEGLTAGVNSLTAVQKVNNVKIDEKPVTVTIVEGGTLVGVDQGPVDLTPGESTQVPFLVQNNETRSNMKGSVTLTAPSGTTFADGQATVAAGYRSGTSGAFRPYTPLDLKNGVRSDGNTKMTFDLDTAGGNMVAGEQYQYSLSVSAPADAAASSGQMGFTYAGDSSKGDYRAQGKTTTTITPSVAAPTGTVTFSDDVTQKATVSGTGVDGATITLYAGASTTAIGTAVVDNGTWSTSIDPIGAGDQKIRIEQSGIDGIQTAETIAQYGAAVTLDEPASSTVAPGLVTVTGAGQAETTVTITGGSEPVTTKVKADGTFTAQVVLEPSNTAQTLTAQQRSKGNLTTSDTITVTPNGAQIAREVVITEPTSHTYQPNRSTTISGTATPYAEIDLRFQWNDTVYGKAKADINGNWSITRGFGPAAKYELTATQTRFDKTTSASAVFNLDPEGITNKEVVITGPADHAYKPGEPTRVTGTATPFAKIELRFQWNDTVYGRATADANGNWNILRAYGPAATYELTATQLRADGSTSLSNTFTLEATGIDRPFTLTTPTMDSTFEAGVPVSFTGTGTRGATITAVAPAWNNNEIFKTEVDDNGKWEIRRGFAPGITYDLTLVQQPVDGEPTSIAGVHLTPAN
jgi:hypothetical protein